MKFPFWLLPIIIAVTIAIAQSEESSEDVSPQKRKKRIVLLSVTLLLGVVLGIATFFFIGKN